MSTRRSPWVVLATATAALLLGSCATDGAPTTAPDQSAPPSTTADTGPTKVDIGGRSLQLSCSGSGLPTVILEAGLAGDLSMWESVQPLVAEKTRVCSYDRAGLGGSDDARTPRTTRQAVQDLEALVEAADLPAPYVLVGFSFGGLVTQHFSATHPDETAGLVLVDSINPRQTPVVEAHLTPRQIYLDRTSALSNREGMDPFASMRQILRAGSLPHVPLVVVSSGVSEGWPEGWDAQLFERLLDELQQDLARSVPDGQRVIAEHSGHEVPREAPDVVIDAITTVLGRVAQP